MSASIRLIGVALGDLDKQVAEIGFRAPYAAIARLAQLLNPDPGQLLGKFFKAICGIGVVLMMGALLRALPASSDILRDAPKSPEPATGHVIPMAVRGVGDVYITKSRSDLLAPYWNTFYVFLGLLIMCVLWCFDMGAYNSFIKERRLDY